MKDIDSLVHTKWRRQYRIVFAPNYFHKEGGIVKSIISQVFNGKQQNISMNLLYEFISTLNISLKEFFDDPIFENLLD